MITIISHLRFLPTISFSLINDSLPTGYISIRQRLPTVVRSRRRFCPSQAENWPARRVKHGREERASPFSAFRRSARASCGIIIITGSPIKLRGTSSVSEPPRCVRAHTRVRKSWIHGCEAASFEITKTSESGTGFARRRSTPKACHDGFTIVRARASTGRCLSETHTDRRFIPSIMRFDRVGVRNNSRDPSGFRERRRRGGGLLSRFLRVKV